MEKIQIKNRYNDLFTFSKTENGNILFKGNFKWMRCGWPNVYTEAYEAYCVDADTDERMTMGEFKEEVHQAVYDSEGKYVSMSDTSIKYGKLVYSDKSKIDMIDPSGGPYMTSGMDMSYIDESFEGMIIDCFKPVPEGYLIIIKNEK
jgi:hypothetical protein